MKKYQIVESYGTHMHAGSKATNDCVNILEELDFEKIEIIRHKPDDKSPVSKIIRHFLFVNSGIRFYINCLKEMFCCYNIPIAGIILVEHQVF